MFSVTSWNDEFFLKTTGSITLASNTCATPTTLTSITSSSTTTTLTSITGSSTTTTLSSIRKASTTTTLSSIRSSSTTTTLSSIRSSSTTTSTNTSATPTVPIATTTAPIEVEPTSAASYGAKSATSTVSVIHWCLDEKNRQRKSDLVAVISGGAEVIRGHEEKLTLNASLSYDPDVGPGDHSGMSFTWYYGEIIGNYSGLRAVTNESFTGVNESALNYSGQAFGLQFIFNTTARSLGTIYVVKLVVVKDCRNSSAYQVIHLVKGNPPEISQR